MPTADHSAASLPMVEMSDIVRLVGQSTAERGREYARRGVVGDIAWDVDAGRLSAEVKGTTPWPYTVTVNLKQASRVGVFAPSNARCTCPVAANCKHTAALLFASNTEHLRQIATIDAATSSAATSSTSTASIATTTAALTTAALTTARDVRSVKQVQETPAPPTWRDALLPEGAAARASTRPGERTGRNPIQSPQRTYSTPLGLRFEMRETDRRNRNRWQPPETRAAKPGNPSDVIRNLAVRPVILNPRGSWVTSGVSWTSLLYLSSRVDAPEDQQRWFAEFAAIHRATRAVYVGHDSDWISLDEFTSPLLWHFLRRAGEVGIPLLGAKKGAVVVLEARTTVGLDAVREPDGGLRFDPSASIGDTAIALGARNAGGSGTTADHGLYCYELGPAPVIRLAPSATTLSVEQQRIVTNPETVTIPAGETDEFYATFYPRLRQRVELRSPDASALLPEPVTPELVLTATFRAKSTRLRLGWGWRYGSHDAGRAAELGMRDEVLEAGIQNRVVKAIADLALATQLAGSMPIPPEPAELDDYAAAVFSSKVIPVLEAVEGVRVEIVGERPDYREASGTPEISVTTVETHKRDWFDLGIVVNVGGYRVPFGPLFKALATGRKTLLMVDKTYLRLDHPELDRLKELLDEAGELAEWEPSRGTPQLSRYQADLWQEFEELADETVQAPAWRATVAGLREVTSIERVDPPATVRATLRPYQRDGLTWLAFLWQHSLGGILADDMGLGKTLQTLALIAHAREQVPDASPFLVVAPTSVVPNWLAEAAKFTPHLVARAVPSTEAALAKAGGGSLDDLVTGADIVVTSYALLRLDATRYNKLPWSGLILDEAQFVKNDASAVHQAARDLDVPFRLAVTGTPMENNLLELRALCQIVAPGLFGTRRRFSEDFVKPIEAMSRTAGRGPESSEALAKLRSRIRPILMRRTKELVAPELPAKQEQVLNIELAPAHRRLYDQVLQRERKKLFGLIDDLDKNRLIVFRSLTLLRLLSLDASLIDEKHAHIPSRKLDALLEQLDDLVAEGHRSLVFSQFTSFLDRAAARLDAAGIPYVLLDGSTRRRSEVISAFTSGQAPVFLISLKAGGFGLNLTQADYVFLLDPWWNPAVEEQAIDRTHRIGQTQRVNVYRLVATNTIEEKVMALKEQKAHLFDALLDDDAVFSQALTVGDVRSLLDV